jgi:hypothetical protein
MSISLEDIFTNKGVSASSKNLYIKNLKRLNENQPVEDIKFLSRPATIMRKIADFKPTTQRTFIISIISLLSQLPKTKKLYDKYYEILLKVNDQIKSDNDTNNKADRLINWESVEEKQQELKEDVDKFRGKSSINQSEYDKLLQYVVLSLYTLIPPRRNKDYLMMDVVDKYDSLMDSDRNYYSRQTNEFIFNNYKTAKTFKQQRQEVPFKLQEVLDIYMKYRPKETPAFLVYYNKKPLKQINAITRILNSTVGDSVGASKLRHSYLTGKYGNILEEMEKDANAMSHSAQTQKEYIYKK